MRTVAWLICIHNACAADYWMAWPDHYARGGGLGKMLSRRPKVSAPPAANVPTAQEQSAAAANAVRKTMSIEQLNSSAYEG